MGVKKALPLGKEKKKQLAVCADTATPESNSRQAQIRHPDSECVVRGGSVLPPCIWISSVQGEKKGKKVDEKEGIGRGVWEGMGGYGLSLFL